MIKVFFRNYPSGVWQNWTDYLIDAPSISKGVESDNDGAAGVIVFDKAEMSFRLEGDVEAAFDRDLTEINRYIFEIQVPNDSGVYKKLFEGVADFSSLSFPEDSNIVKFQALDKISSLSLLNPGPARTVRNTLKGAFSPAASEKVFVRQISDNVLSFEISDTQTNVEGSGAIRTPSGNEIKVGEVLEFNIGDRKIFALIRSYSVQEVSLDVSPWYYYRGIANVLLSEDLGVLFTSEDDVKVYNKEVYGQDPNIIVGGFLENFDALKIVHGIVKNQWSGIDLINKTGSSIVLFPADYFSKLINEKPLGESPLEALKQISASLQSYIFINKDGDLVIYKRENLGSGSDTKSIGTAKIFSAEKKFLWDKIVDSVKVEIKSPYVAPNGDQLKGEAEIVKNENVEPRNPLDLKLIAVGNAGQSLLAQLELDYLAESEGQKVFNFYGMRHESVEIEFDLNDETLEIDLLDNIIYKLEAYFFTKLEYDLLERKISAELVSLNTYNYDSNQISVKLSEKNELLGTELQKINQIKAELKEVKTQISLNDAGENILAIAVDNLKVEYYEATALANDTNPKITSVPVNEEIYNKVRLSWDGFKGCGDDPEGSYRHATDGKAYNLTADVKDRIKEYIIFHFVGTAPFTTTLFPVVNEVSGEWFIKGVLDQRNQLDASALNFTIENLEIGKYHAFFIGARFELTPDEYLLIT